MQNSEVLVGQLNRYFEKDISGEKVYLPEEDVPKCKQLFSRNIVFLRAYLGLVAKGSPYDQVEFAGILGISIPGLRRWEAAEVIPNKLSMQAVCRVANNTLMTPIPIQNAHLLFRNLVNEITLLRMGTHNNEFQRLPSNVKRSFATFVNNNMDQLLEYFMQQARTSELNFQTLVDQSPFGIALFNINPRRLEYLNHAWYTILDYTEEDYRMMKRAPLDIIHPDDVSLAEERMEMVAKGEKTPPLSKPYRVYDKSGKIYYFEITSRLISISGEQKMLSVAQNVTEKHEALIKLEQNEQTMRATLESARAGSFSFENETGKIYLDDRAMQIHGLSGHENLLEQNDLYRFLHPDDMDHIVKAHKDAVEAKQSNFTIEYRMILPESKQVCHVQSSSTFHYDQNGKLKDIRGIVIDVTSQRKTEEKLHITEQALDQTSAIAVITNADGIITYVNNSFIKTTGYTINEVLGKKPNILKSGHHPDSFYSELWKTITTGETWRGEFYNMKKDGSYYWERALITPIRDINNKITHFAAIKEDITKEKNMEQALAESEERYRLLFSSMFTGFALHEVITNDEGKPINYRYIDVNPAFEKMTGIQAKDIIGKTVLDVLPNTEPYWIERFGNVALTGKPDYIVEYAQEFGKFYEVHGYSPRRGQFAVTFMDVTDKIKTQKEADQLKFMVDNTNSMVLLSEHGSRDILYVNEAICEELGYSRKELLKMNIDDIDKSYGQIRQEVLQELNKQGKSDFDSQLIRKDNSTLRVHIYVSMREYEDSKLIIANIIKAEE